MKQHVYKTLVTWTGNRGQGTRDYKAYDRSHVVSVVNKAPLQCSSDPSFRGDATKLNPEELLVSALSSCHMLWYLHICSDNGIIVTEYIDEASGVMEEDSNGSGQFSEVILKPRVSIAPGGSLDKANQLHDIAHRMCFIARSCNFMVKHFPVSFHKS